MIWKSQMNLPPPPGRRRRRIFLPFLLATGEVFVMLAVILSMGFIFLWI